MLDDHSPRCPCALAPAEKSRNLVVCIDGTSYHLGVDAERSSNVFRFYCRLLSDDAEQLKYYKNGIGAAAPDTHSSWSPTRLIGDTVDLAIAWNLERGITEAYSWLSERYRPGDRIYLLGFSRGAYQVRALAAMIETVGLMREGHQEHIPHAYHLYSRLYSSHHGVEKAARFKASMSRRGVCVHFVGVWDTVSSVGLVGHTRLPLSELCDHICVFRHALALDEQRVKFEPECAITGGNVPPPPNAKEVWFAGSHSDIGGGEGLPDDTLNLESVPLLWMQNEAFLAGLHFEIHNPEWKVDDLARASPHNSMSGAWMLLEAMPIRRTSQHNPKGMSRTPHHGKGRAIYPGQKIHASVAFMGKDYQPKASLSHIDASLDWTRLVSRGPSGHFTRAAEWSGHLEMDIFDLAAGPALIQILNRTNILGGDVLHILNRLNFLTTLRDGETAILGVPDVAQTLKRYLSPQDQLVFLATAKLLAKLAIFDNSIAHTALQGLVKHDEYTGPISSAGISEESRAKFDEYADSPPSYTRTPAPANQTLLRSRS